MYCMEIYKAFNQKPAKVASEDTDVLSISFVILNIWVDPIETLRIQNSKLMFVCL